MTHLHFFLEFSLGSPVSSAQSKNKSTVSVCACVLRWTADLSRAYSLRSPWRQTTADQSSRPDAGYVQSGLDGHLYLEISLRRTTLSLRLRDLGDKFNFIIGSRSVSHSCFGIIQLEQMDRQTGRQTRSCLFASVEPVNNLDHPKLPR